MIMVFSTSFTSYRQCVSGFPIIDLFTLLVNYILNNYLYIVIRCTLLLIQRVYRRLSNYILIIEISHFFVYLHIENIKCKILSVNLLILFALRKALVKKFWR